MSEGKYGRLFTARDVERIVGVAHQHGMPASAAIELLDKLQPTGDPPNLTFGPDEPLFLLRGQDRFAPDGVSGYFEALQAEDDDGDWLVGEAHRDAVAAAGNALDRWQAEHPGRVKVPD